MTLTEALRIAQAALLDTPGIVLNRKTGEAHPLPGASDELHERADAHNALGRHAKALEGCGK
ncbi:hypothetical protein E5S69_20575 [Cupriavidus necator]|uniref:hypothetical protein n=1 Tax=Cupriavidus necator TaxID=106590 RepID=UPI00148FA56D|nr:hypothetical protein [Cupriavidus necator]NOV25901.1 hypothetical protein [Cupriavidus necator]